MPTLTPKVSSTLAHCNKPRKTSSALYSLVHVVKSPAVVFRTFRYPRHLFSNHNLSQTSITDLKIFNRTGAYLGIVCLIGLFAIRTAIGPLILMIIYLIFIALFHLSLNSAIDPLLMYLPKSLQVEEESLLALENGNTNGDYKTNEKSVRVAATDKQAGDSSDTDGKHLPDVPHKQPNFITKFLFPHIYTDYHTLRRLVPRGFAEIEYAPETERDAFYHPAISSPTPILWIPRDEMGVSRQECNHSSRVIPMTDEAASFDAKGKLVWDQENARPPIYQEKIYY